jgi:cytoskeletal protein CcmA (bactofilin family)
MAAKSTTVIAPGTVVSGRVEGAEDLTVLGQLRGTLRLEGELLVDAEARVEADAEVTAAVIHGIYVGNVIASERVELSATARVLGDLAAPRIIIEEGAAFSGAIDMGDVEAAEPAPRRPAAAATPARPGARPAATTPGRPGVPAPGRPAPAPARPAPPPARPTPAPRPSPAPAPVPASEPAPALAEEGGGDEPEGEEPDLPEGAAPKKVNVRKKK